MMVIVAQVIIIVLFSSLLVRAFLQRGLPQVGGKLGPLRTLESAAPVPDGFSSVYARVMTVFAATADATSFSSLKAFLRHGTVGQPTLMRIYRVAGCKAEIEIPVEPPGYERIDAAEALALLRELPDLRVIRRLHLSDEPSFLDPWAQMVRGQTIFLLGHATNFRLVVLYKPNRRHGHLVGLTLLHEWLHIVAFDSWRDVWRFTRANAVEPLEPPAIEPVNFGVRKTPAYEAWCDLGEKLFGYEDAVARQAALASPLHAMIVWRRVEKIMRKAPARFRSTRFAEFEARAVFMHTEVAPKARHAWTNRRLWSRLRRP
jgi:hypothetical protein